jgi:hypothetical protein
LTKPGQSPAASALSLAYGETIPQSAFRNLNPYKALELLSKNPTKSNVDNYLQVAFRQWNINKDDLFWNGDRFNYSWLTQQRIEDGRFSMTNAMYAEVRVLTLTDTVDCQLGAFVRKINNSGLINGVNKGLLPEILESAYGLAGHPLFELKQTPLGKTKVVLLEYLNENAVSKFQLSSVGWPSLEMFSPLTPEESMPSRVPSPASSVTSVATETIISIPGSPVHSIPGSPTPAIQGSPTPSILGSSAANSPSTPPKTELPGVDDSTPRARPPRPGVDPSSRLTHHEENSELFGTHRASLDLDNASASGSTQPT